MISKAVEDFSKADFSEGEAILIDKEQGVSSFGVIRRLRKITGVKKIGHAGTLDPNATGLLIICTAKKTKEIYKYQDAEKTYSGTITLGKSTPSMDGETEFIKEGSIEDVTAEKIEEVRKTFLGTISQLPPMYSAIKHKGKSLYKYARQGKEIERTPREIFVKEFNIDEIELPDLKFTLVCSKGTYVRVIANDFGDKLGCGAYLKDLRREAIGSYNVKDAFSIDEFEEMVKSSNSIAD